jgi:hypothetical protein
VLRKFLDQPAVPAPHEMGTETTEEIAASYGRVMPPVSEPMNGDAAPPADAAPTRPPPAG